MTPYSPADSVPVTAGEEVMVAVEGVPEDAEVPDGLIVADFVGIPGEVVPPGDVVS